MAYVSSGFVFLVLCMQLCSAKSLDIQCKPSSNFLQKLLETGRYRSYYFNGSCFIKHRSYIRKISFITPSPRGPPGLGGKVICKYVDETRKIKVSDKLTITVKRKGKRCG